jgi:hypothetical protein
VKQALAHLRAYLEAVAPLSGGRLQEDRGVAWAATGSPWFWWALPDTPPAALEAAEAAGAAELDREAAWRPRSPTSTSRRRRPG